MSEHEHPLGATFAGLLLFIIGLGIAGGMYQIDSKERQLRRGWVRTDGTVVQVLKRQTLDGPVFAPLIVFQATSGARVSFTARVGKASPQHAIGERVPVVYPPQNPEAAEIDTARQRLIRNIVAVAGALLLICLGGTVAWQASRLHRRRLAAREDRIAMRVSESAVIPAPPARVYTVLADYHQHHPRIVPPKYFKKIEVLHGGIGAGTRTRITMRVLGVTRVFEHIVSEPLPGRVLVEAEPDGSNPTTFTVDPAGENATHLTISTELKGRGGIAGAIEGWLSARVLPGIYRAELARIAEYVRGR